MIEILQFIFKSFWHFMGSLMLCGIIFGGLGQMFSKHNHYYTTTKDNVKEENAQDE